MSSTDCICCAFIGRKDYWGLGTCHIIIQVKAPILIFMSIVLENVSIVRGVGLQGPSKHRFWSPMYLKFNPRPILTNCGFGILLQFSKPLFPHL